MPTNPAPQDGAGYDANAAAGDDVNASAGDNASAGADGLDFVGHDRVADSAANAGAGDNSNANATGDANDNAGDDDANANAAADGLDALLTAIADAHPDRVAGWIRNEPGHWGFFAGQSVLAVRNLLGRRLSEPERRFVWHQMWQILQERRRQTD